MHRADWRKALLVLTVIGLIGFLGSWALWGGTYDGYVPVLVRVKVMDVNDGRPIPEAVLITLDSTGLLEDREYLQKAIAHSLHREPGRLVDHWTDLLHPVHASRTDSQGRADVVALARTSGALIGDLEITRDYHKSRPALALIRAPGYVESRIELRPYLEGPVGEPEHMIADLGSVALRAISAPPR